MTAKNLGILLGSLASAGIVNFAQAQSSDALLDKLVQKGILTQQEAADLRKEASSDFTKAYQVKTGLPSWVTSLRIGGDFRGRYDMIQGDNEDFRDRHRFRYRLRAGAVATMMENFEVGFRLTSGEQQGNFGGDPISGNATLQNNGSKKFVFVDLAYARWSPVISDSLRNATTIGKMENPFVFSDLVFDADYTPEGIGSQFVFALNEEHAFKLNLGGFALDELSNSSRDPYFFGGQARWDAKWSKKLDTSLGVMAFSIYRSDSLVNAAVPDINFGNTREGAAGELAHYFNPVYGDVGVGYNLDEFPIHGFYPGAFPVRIVADVLHNPAAPTRNSAFSAGILLGKSGKKGTWDLSYRYRFIEADANYEEFVESDFGAFYPSGGGGFRAGTNLKGHVVKVNYSAAHSLTFGVSYILAELLQEDAFVGPGQDDDTLTSRLLVDAIWKF
jgi:hypothetical protein